MMKKRVFCFLLTVFIICAFSVNSFAFGQFSFNDETINGYDTNYFWWNNGKTDISTSGMPAYHLLLENGQEVIEYLHTVKNPANYISGSIIYVPILNRYYYVIKQSESLNFDLENSSRYITYSLGFGYSESSGITGPSRDRITYKSTLLPPIRFWFGSYYYIFEEIYSNGGSGSYIDGSSKVQQYSAKRYSELKQEELDKLVEASGVDDLAGAESLGGMSAASEELGGETTTIIDESSESEKYSEEFSKIDEMISNLDDFSNLASSNLVEVSSALGDMRSGIDLVLGMFPKLVIALMILGLVMIIVVKIIGR